MTPPASLHSAASEEAFRAFVSARGMIWIATLVNANCVFTHSFKRTRIVFDLITCKLSYCMHLFHERDRCSVEYLPFLFLEQNIFLLMRFFSRSCFHVSDLLEPKRISSVGEACAAS